MQELQSGPPNAHLLFSMHATYCRRGLLYSRLDPRRIVESCRPDKIVTLIDDIFDVATIIKDRDQQDTLRLREIASWRAAELMIGDLLASFAHVSNYVIAVKHPAAVLEQLLFQPNRKTVYVSFPITSTRADVQKRQEINSFKAQLRSTGVTAFDPATIDELFLLYAARTGDITPVAPITIRSDDRWEYESETALCSGRPLPRSGSDLIFSKAEVDEASTDLRRQIETRDFRLIEDSEAMVVYRPNWGGTPSQGVMAELQFARDRGKRLFIYSPAEDEQSGSPFRDYQAYQTVSELLGAVRQWQGA